jgi:hypothetical protein
MILIERERALAKSAWLIALAPNLLERICVFLFLY